MELSITDICAHADHFLLRDMSCLCCWTDVGDNQRRTHLNSSIIESIIYRIVSLIKLSIMDRLKYRSKRYFVLMLIFFLLGFLACYLAIYSGLLTLGGLPPSVTPIPDNFAPVLSSKPEIVLPTASPIISPIQSTAEMSSPKHSTSSEMQRLEMLNKKFDDTIKTCLGDSCFNEPVGNKLNRIGLLAPLHSGGEAVLAVIKQSMEGHKNAHIEVIYDTHVPAYGYGKNHGWTRIIRLLPPIVPHSLTLLEGQSLETRLEAQVQQLLRWHCRLSHVAAHTRMLTVYMDDLLRRPAVEFHNIMTFIDAKFSRDEMLAAIQKWRPKLEEDLGITQLQQLSVAGLQLDSAFISRAANAMQSEFDKTQNLSKWPCPSFRDFDKNKELSLLHKAPMLAANCSDPFVTCSVKYDQNGG